MIQIVDPWMSGVVKIPKGDAMHGDMEMEIRFNHHPPTSEAVGNYHADWREKCRAVAQYAVDNLPSGREASLVLTKLEEAMFWGNAAIARNHRKGGPGDQSGMDVG